MAKCLICAARKGKRLCSFKQGLVCSLCCGTTREKELCADCPYYQEPSQERRYSQVPAFTVQMMDGDMELQSYSNALESALCAFDVSTHVINDRIALRIMELLLDKYHFNDPPTEFDSQLLEDCFREVDQVVTTDMIDLPSTKITRILAVVYLVASRRSQGNREYVDFIHDYVGVRIASGVRAVRESAFRS